MEKSDERSLTPAKAHSISTAATSLAGRGLRDLQKVEVFLDSRDFTNKGVSDSELDEARLISELTRYMDGAFRLGYYHFKDAANYALDVIREFVDEKMADAITLNHLQGAYIGMSGKYKDRGATPKKEVVAFESLDEIIDYEAQSKPKSQAPVELEKLKQDREGGHKPPISQALKIFRFREKYPPIPKRKPEDKNPQPTSSENP